MKRSLLFLTALCLAFCAFVSCGDSDASEETTIDTEITVAPEENNTVVIAEKGKSSEFQLVYGLKDDESPQAAFSLAKLIKELTDNELERVADALPDKERDCEILVGAFNRPECAELYDTLSDDEYAIKVIKAGEKTKIIFAYKGVFALMCAIDRFEQEYLTAENGKIEVPAELDVRGKFSEADAVIVSRLPQLRGRPDRADQ